jgi:hypothetical protein
MWVTWLLTVLSSSPSSWLTWPGIVDDVVGVFHDVILMWFHVVVLEWFHVVVLVWFNASALDPLCHVVRYNGVWPTSSCGFDVCVLGSLCVI